MTKKIFAMFLAVLMVVSLLPVSALAVNATCPGLGKGHTLSNCTSTVASTIEVTCGSNGYISHKCEVCGTMFVTDIKKATGEHNFVFNPDSAKKPTCDTAGNTAGEQCTVCEAMKPGTYKVIPALGVDRDDADKIKCEYAVIENTYNCLTGGHVLLKCQYEQCGNIKRIPEKEEDDFKDSNKKAHSWKIVEVLTPATEKTEGKAVIACVNPYCGEQNTITLYFKHNHKDFLTQVYGWSPDCINETNGRMSYYECRACGKMFSDDQAKNEIKSAEDLVIPFRHFFSLNPTDKLPCMNGGKEVFEFKCLVCEEMIDAASYVSHDFNEWEYSKQKSQTEEVFVAYETCEKVGQKFRTCEACGIKEFKEIPATGHDVVVVEIEATCVNPYIKYTYCVNDRCDGNAKIQDKAEKFAANYFHGGALAYYIEELEKKADSNDLEHPFGKTFTLMIEDGVLSTGMEATWNFTKAAEFTISGLCCERDTKNSFNLKTNGKFLKVTSSADGIKYELKDKASEASEFELVALHGDVFYSLAVKTSGTVIAVLGTTAELDWVAAEDLTILTFEYTTNKAGAPIFDPTNHDMQPGDVVIPPTCYSVGYQVYKCSGCGAQSRVEIPAEHNLQEVAGTTIVVDGKTEAVKVEAACGVQGYTWMECTSCLNRFKITVPALEHHFDSEPKAPDHTHMEGQAAKCNHDGCNFEKPYVGDLFNFNTTFESLEEAKKVHGITGDVVEHKMADGDCNIAAIYYIDCDACHHPVMYKKYFAGNGMHEQPETANAKLDYKAATCTTDGKMFSYECKFCGELQTNGQDIKEVGVMIVLPALGHDFKVNEKYKAAAHDSPNFNNVVKTCQNCGLKVTDGTTAQTVINISDSKVCGTTYAEVYLCHCGEYHMKSYVEFEHKMEKYGEWDPTCTRPGYDLMECRYMYNGVLCGFVNYYHILNGKPQLPHINKDNQPFFDNCLDTVEDRTCVNCFAKHMVWETFLDPTHECDEECESDYYYPAYHHFNRNDIPASCIDHAWCLAVCPDCGDEVLFSVDVPYGTWIGHRPVVNYTTSVHYMNYVYADYPFYNYEPECIFLEYVASTHSTEGKWVGLCAECGEIVTQVMPKLQGVEFTMDAVNAIDGSENVILGSTVAVTINMNAKDVAIWCAKMEVKFTNGFMFVGAETKNDGFKITTTNAETANNNGVIVIEAEVENDAKGNHQEVVINGETAVITLFFRVMTDARVGIQMNDFVCEVKELLNANVKESNVVSFTDSDCKANVKQIEVGNLNDDAIFTMADLMAAADIFMGAAEDTYAVAIDLDHDGVITVDDLAALKDLMVGNIDKYDVVFMGASDAEIELFNNLNPLECSKCHWTTPYGAMFCEHCGKSLKRSYDV